MANFTIWDAIDFSGDREETAYDLLREQSEMLEAKTENHLSMQVSYLDSYLDEEQPKAIFAYPLYIIANHLGRYRKKILTVVQEKATGPFPVDIHSHLDDQRYEKVSKDEFLRTIQSILGHPEVSASIKSLYDMSREKSQNRAS